MTLSTLHTTELINRNNFKLLYPGKKQTSLLSYDSITTRDIVGMQVYRSLYFTFAQATVHDWLDWNEWNNLE